MFEGGVGGRLGPRLLQVLLPVKLRLLLHGLCICMGGKKKNNNKEKIHSSVVMAASPSYYQTTASQVAVKYTVLRQKVMWRAFVCSSGGGGVM